MGQNLKTGYIHLPFNEIIRFTLPADQYFDLLNDYRSLRLHQSTEVMKIPLNNTSNLCVMVPVDKILYIKAED